MPDRNDRDRNDRDRNEAPEPEELAAREPEATLRQSEEARRDAEPGPPSPEPMPAGPNEDDSFGARVPDDVKMNRTSDDNDLNPAGSGHEDTMLREEYESIARRDQIARGLEDLLADAREWEREARTEQARDVLEALNEAYDRLGVPTEHTDAEPGIPQAEAGPQEGAGGGGPERN